jgi:hypothetical protein
LERRDSVTGHLDNAFDSRNAGAGRGRAEALVDAHRVRPGVEDGLTGRADVGEEQPIR